MGGQVELQPACDHVGHGDEVSVGSVSVSLGFGGLDETVDALEDAVVDA